MSANLPRALLWLAFALAFVVIGASSGLRLAADGLGCEPWPACYGRTTASQAVQPSPAERAVRLAHRVAASAFALAALTAVVLGWRRWSRPARRAGLLLIGVTALLSVVGRFTPSGLPAVTLVNVLGGVALLGGTGYLLATGSPGSAAGGRPRAMLYAAMLLVALQAATGATISVREAGAACELRCAAEWPVSSHRLWHPLQPGSANEIAPGARAGETLHAVHRLLAIFVIVVTIGAAALAAHRRDASRRLLAALAACMATGLALTFLDGALGAVVLHALAAGVLVAGMGAVMAIGPIRREVT